MNRYRHVGLCAALLGATCLSALTPALAQQELGDIEEIIISATKRAQGLQDVPIAVSAYSAELLQNAGVSDLRELTQIAPSLMLTSSQSEAAGATARIRGIGTTGDNPGLESSVAVFIDGVYRSRNSIGLTELGPIERVEILRGPQGTLFGRNASAGLINIVTQGPTNAFTGYGEASYGNFDYIRLAAGLSGPLAGDRLGARIDGIYLERDGFLKDKVTGKDYNDRERFLLRGQLRAEPTETVTLRLIADYAERDEQCCAAVTLVRGPTAAFIEALGGQLGSGGTPAGSNPFDRRSATTPGRDFLQDVEEGGVSLEANWQTGIGTLTSISAYREWHNERGQDADFSSADILFRPSGAFLQDFETFTQELRLNGRVGILDWLVAGYYANEDLRIDDTIAIGSDYESFASLLVDVADGAVDGFAGTLPFPGFRAFLAGATGGLFPNALALGTEGSSRFDQNSESWALFTHNILSITDALELTLGLRYTQERKRVDATITTVNPTCSLILSNPAFVPLAQLPCLPFFNPAVDGVFDDGRRKETQWSGTAALNYVWNDGFSSYASYSRGYKAGGFNLDRAGLTPFAADLNSDLQFEEETVDSVELGFKWRTADRRASINASGFYSRFEDFQVNTFNGIAFVVQAVPKATVKGVEVEASLRPTDRFSVQGGVTYADTQYGKNLPGAIFAPPSPTNPLGGALWQLPGSRLTNAPEWAVTGSATYRYPVADSFLSLLHVDFRYTSKVNTGSDLDLEKLEGGVFQVNGRIGFGDIDERWSIEVWARNIFDENYSQVIIDAPLQGSGTARNTLVPNTQTFDAFLAEPRTYGVTLRGAF
ncbi:MAG: TonB-dependent receptor [Alphaproteobacteria bacterium]|nr:MAG: TonB-dependent receptor [Alphaproteobacteria bacterium]